MAEHAIMSTSTTVKTLYTPEQTEILLRYFTDKGMTSAGKTQEALHAEAAEATGLSAAQVKAWIGNYRAKTNPRPRPEPKQKGPPRALSEFHLFCKGYGRPEHLKDSSMPEFNRARAADYRNAPQEERAALAISASRLKKKVQEPSSYTREEKDAKIQQLEKKLQFACDELGKFGVEVGVLFWNKEVNVLGTKRGIHFLGQGNVPIEFHCHFTGATYEAAKKVPEREILRQQIKEGLNGVFGAAHGLASKPVPYSQIGTKWCVDGLPEGCSLGPKKQPSTLTLAELRSILDALDNIKFVRIEEDSTLPQPRPQSSAVAPPPESSAVAPPPASSAVAPPPESSVVAPPPESSAMAPPLESSAVPPPPKSSALPQPPKSSANGESTKPIKRRKRKLETGKEYPVKDQKLQQKVAVCLEKL